jgi:hypothetical protein
MSKNIVFAFNYKKEKVGRLTYESVGRHWHWCWYQTPGFRMSPGCLQEVRDMQKELLSKRKSMGDVHGQV